MLPHVIQRLTIDALGQGLLEHDIPIAALENLASANYLLAELGLGRVAAQRSDVSAGIIATALGEPTGQKLVERLQSSLQSIKRASNSREVLSNLFNASVQELDPSGAWRLQMADKTEAALIRLGNLRSRALTIEAPNRIGMLRDILSVLANHNMDMTALDSQLISKADGSEWVNFDIAISNEHVPCSAMIIELAETFMRNFILILFALVFGATLQAATLSPSRTVDLQSVLSMKDPSIRIDLPIDAQFIGSDRWNLFEVADAEIYMFVEADANKKIIRYYWIQFEAYLPSATDYFYEYKNGTNEIISDLDFNLRARFGPTAETPKTGSDLEHAYKLIADAGYTLPPDLMNVRFVHLTDASKRKELMVIYAEDLALAGLSSTDFISDGKINAKWSPIEAKLIERAKQSIAFYPTK
jgi:glycine cleavage system regulatory protein